MPIFRANGQSIPQATSVCPGFAAQLALCLALCLCVHLPQIFAAGFLSDDFGLMAKLREVSALTRIEAHHYSPFVQILLKLAAQGSLSAPQLAGIGLAVHLANLTLALALLRLCLGPGLPAWLGAALFGLAAPGVEALGWRCAIGYLGTAFWILLGLWLLLRSFARGRLNWRLGFALALLQALALATWEGGSLFTPILALSFAWLVWRGQAQKRPALLRDSLRCLGPALVCLAGLTLLKLSCGLKAGYELNSLPKALTILLSAPSLVLYPLLSKTFYLSSLNLLLCLIVNSWLVYRLRRCPAGLWLLGLFYLSLAPNALFSGLASRSLYLPCLFFFAALALALPRLKHQTLAWLWLGLNFLLAFYLAGLWSGAARDARNLIQAIESLPQDPAALVVVNLPDHGGPRDLNMPPLLFRNAEAAFARPFERVNTLDADFVTQNQFRSDIPQTRNLSRQEISALYSGKAIFEIVRSQDRESAFALRPFCPAVTEKSGG